MEGVDGAGKSTQAPLLAEALGAQETFQFGATAIGDALRRILLDPPGRHFDPRAEALLIIADKAQHVAEIVGPALRAGRDVVSDRFTASTIAYQGYGRGLDIAVLRSIMDFATGGIEPDLTVLLDVDPDMALSRLGPQEPPQLEFFDPPAASADDASDRVEPAFDRFEGAGQPFRERVRKGYLELAAANPDCWVVVSGDAPVDEVAAQIISEVQKRLRDRAGEPSTGPAR